MDALPPLAVILILSFYFLPFLIARTRRTEHSRGIFWVNLLFGWTILGWFAALIWAVAEKTMPEPPPPETSAEWFAQSQSKEPYKSRFNVPPLG